MWYSGRSERIVRFVRLAGPSRPLRVRVLPVMALLFGLSGWSSAPVLATDLDVVKHNVLTFLTADGADRNDPFVSTALSKLNTKATTLLSTVNPDGSWSDLNYTQIPGDSWPLGRHYDRILSMAKAYITPGQSLFGDISLKSAIERALAYGYKYIYPGVNKLGNWWWWKIGVPRKLAPTLLLLQGKVESQVFTKELETLAYLIGAAPGSSESQNTIWTTMNHLCYALLVNDSLWMRDKVVATMASAVVVTTTAGIKSDYSFHHHGPQLYTGGYGGEYAEDIAEYVLFTRGTSYQLPSTNFDTFITYVAEGVRWALYHNYFDPSVIGREVTRATEKGTPGLAALLMLSQVPSPRQDEFTAAAKKMLETWNFSVSVENSGLVTPVRNSAVAASWPTGDKHFPRSDYSVHRRPGYYASVKMISARTKSAEKVNGEGLKSWFLSDGMTYVVKEGNEYYRNNVWPTLDWTRLPGTTVEQKSRTAGGYGFGSQTFVGGTHADGYGVAAMDFAATKYQKGSNDWTRSNTVASASCLTAKKSYFFFDEEVVALGSDITCPSTNPVETIVMQWPLSTADAPLSVDGIGKPSSPGWSETLSNITSAQADGIGYYFPGGQTVNAKREIRSGKWSDLNLGESTTVYTNPILTLWYDHGTNPSGQSYRYAVLPGKSLEEMASYAASVPISILAHDGRVHAVKDHLLNAVGAVFWEADSVDKVTVDRPCILFYRTEGDVLTIAASDPTQATSTLHVTINETLTPLELPAGVTSTTTATTTTITYNVRGGLTSLARFSVQAGTAVPTLSFSADPTSIAVGQSTTLTWSASNTTTCTAFGGWSGTKAASGSESVSPTQTTTYVLSCTGEGGSVSASVSVDVSSVVNQPPVLALIGNKSVREGQPLSFSVTATDPDGDPLTYTASPLPSGASFTGQAFSWTPVPGQAGSYTVTFSVSDGTLQDAEPVTMTVQADSLTISGTIRQTTGQPLSGAVAKIENIEYPDGSNVKTVTDTQGRFSLADLQTTNKLQAALQNCQQFGQCDPVSVTVEASKKGWVLTNPATGVNEVTVTLDPANLQDVTGVEFVAVRK